MSEAVLVTGAAGFIGSQLCRAIVTRGDMAVGVDNFDPFYSRVVKTANLQRIGTARFECVEADICDAERMRQLCERVRPTTIIHLAALAGVRPSIAEPARYTQVNVRGLISMLEAARAAGCQRFIFASSSSVYGNSPKVPFAEADPVDEPISPYAATKRAGELICQTYARLYDLRIAALRFFTVYGPAQRPDLAISKFMRLIDAGEAVPMFGDGSTSRDYTYIDDVIAGVLAAHDLLANPQQTLPHASQSQGFFRIYNLGGAHPVSLTELIDSIAQVVGKPARIKPCPLQCGDVQRTWADLARSEAELGYRPQTPFHVGLQHQWEWMRKCSLV